MNEKGKPVFVDSGPCVATAFTVRRTVSIFAIEGGDRIGYHRTIAANMNALEQIEEYATDAGLDGDFIGITSCPGETPQAIPFQSQPQNVVVTF